MRYSTYQRRKQLHRLPARKTRTNTIRVYITSVAPVLNRLANGYATASRAARPPSVGRWRSRRTGRSRVFWLSLTSTTAEKAARGPEPELLHGQAQEAPAPPKPPAPKPQPVRVTTIPPKREPIERPRVPLTERELAAKERCARCGTKLPDWQRGGACPEYACWPHEPGCYFARPDLPVRTAEDLLDPVFKPVGCPLCGGGTAAHSASAVSAADPS